LDRWSSQEKDLEAEPFGDGHLVVIESCKCNRFGDAVGGGQVDGVGHLHRVKPREFAGPLEAQRVNGDDGDTAPVIPQCSAQLVGGESVAADVRFL
jgi:hypothetical protein